MNLIPKIKEHMLVDKKLRFRDRRGHYASSALQCKRDQFRSLKGEPQSDPADFIGRMKMLVGTAIENELIKAVFSDLHWYGIHLMGTQVQVGGTARQGVGATWDGALDALVCEKQPDGSFKKYVVEIKTKSGYGADELHRTFEPSEEYASQLGLYLRDLHEKGVTSEGCLFFMLMSDNHFGKLLQLFAHYDAAEGQVVFTHGVCSDGTEREINLCKKLSEIDSNWQKLEEYVAKNELPPADYVYKYELTEERLASTSDYKMRQMLDGKVVLGDWQPKYSGWKKLNLATDGAVLGYTDAELALIRAEYLKRHPKSKK